LATEHEFQQLFDTNSVDIVMIDPTWAGGVTNSMAVAELAHRYSLPVSFHDCTGPATMMAGASMASAIPNHEIQEVARSFVNYVYPTIAETDAQLNNGHLVFGSGIGLGLRLNPELGALDGVAEFVLHGSAR
jgi:L-alanine-DL-glutamate epimerase-like enolase superfamily enzyme